MLGRAGAGVRAHARGRRSAKLPSSEGPRCACPTAARLPSSLTDRRRLMAPIATHPHTPPSNKYYGGAVGRPGGSSSDNVQHKRKREWCVCVYKQHAGPRARPRLPWDERTSGASSPTTPPVPCLPLSPNGRVGAIWGGVGRGRTTWAAVAPPAASSCGWQGVAWRGGVAGEAALGAPGRAGRRMGGRRAGCRGEICVG